MKRHDLVIIGGGTGGLVSALIAAGVGARVAMVERARPGGDCLWTGCVPSKSLLAAAAAAHTMRTADRFGLESVAPQVDFAAVMARVHGVIAAIEPHDSAERLSAAGVEVIEASGRLLGPQLVEAGGQTLRTRATILATGAAPVLPELPGLAGAEPLTTDTVWELTQLPRRLLILGGGAIGCELGQAFARLGATVTIVERADRLLPGSDPAAGRLVGDRLASEGIEVRCNTEALRVVRADGAFRLECAAGAPLDFDRILVAVGRRPRSAGLGLEQAGIRTRGDGAVIVDGSLRTDVHGIYAVGDLTGLAPYTHVAAHHARVAAPNALFHTRARISDTLPRVVYTDPELAEVGLSPTQARQRWGDRARIAHVDYGTLDRALTAAQTDGFATLVGDPRGRLVGAVICGPAAGETIGEHAAWIAAGRSIADVSRAVHAYPTFSEGPARAADALLTERLLGSGTRRLAAPVLGTLRALERRR